MNTLLDSLGVDLQEFIDLRRDLHRYPELSFREHRTSDIVAQRLLEWGYKVERGLGGTGVVGQIARGDGERHIGIRADMDALPIEEDSGYAWVSKARGVMHACGHDGHIAMLLAAAKALACDMSWTGTLTLIFQPAEEEGSSRSGAARMIEDGLFEKYPVDAIYAMHNAPGMPQGTLLFRDGPAMASSDKAIIRIIGRGGHAARPDQTADPTVAAASLVMALQTVVSRNIAPTQTAVISVGLLNAGRAYNVIPQEATVGLSIRALEPAVRELLERRICAIAQDQARSYGCEAEVEYGHGYSALVNTLPETDFARSVALEMLGPEQVVTQRSAATGSEDFAFMLECKPGCYLFIGNGAPGTPGSCTLHNRSYDFNDENIVIGAAYWHLLARRYLAPD
ncbi:M20 aminoacylase family protein (plasmid) [Variovorax sp. 375MFSha3.1]|uniref:M20 aminoacylase family protein n=1 Tax=unclassified Variovorax TaxID=663243 RepID=UPI003AAF0EF1